MPNLKIAEANSIFGAAAGARKFFPQRLVRFVKFSKTGQKFPCDRNWPPNFLLPEVNSLLY
jgi:hypothetical protein